MCRRSQGDGTRAEDSHRKSPYHPRSAADRFPSHLYRKTYPSDTRVGYLTEEWTRKLGLTTNVAVAVGALDSHMGAVGVEIKPGDFVRVIGTSTCDIMAVPYEEMGNRLIPGICGQVDGSVIPG